MQIINRGAGRQPVRRRIEGQRGAPRFAVEPLIDQQHPIVAVKLGASRCRAVRGARRALRTDRQNHSRTGSTAAGRRPDRRNCARRAADRRCRATERSCAEYGRGPFPGRCAGRPSDPDWSDRRRTPNCRRAGWSRAAAAARRSPAIRGATDAACPHGTGRRNRRMRCAAVDVAAAVEHDECVAVFERARRPGRLRCGDGERASGGASAGNDERRLRRASLRILATSVRFRGFGAIVCFSIAPRRSTNVAACGIGLGSDAAVNDVDDAHSESDRRPPHHLRPWRI